MTSLHYIFARDGSYSFTLYQLKGIVTLHNQAFEDKATLEFGRAGNATPQGIGILTSKFQRSKDRFISTMVCIFAGSALVNC